MKPPPKRTTHRREAVDSYRLLDVLLTRRYLMYLTISAVMLVSGLGRLTRDNDWQFFSWGSDLLFGEHYKFVRRTYFIDPTLPGGFELYAHYPFLQIGPPALLAAKLLQVGPRHGIVLAGVAIQGLGVAFVLLVERTFPPQSRRAKASALIAGSTVLVMWGLVTHYRHLDDALTLTALGGAAWALTRHRAVMCGCLLGVAAASKPWGLPVLALTLALPSWRSRTCAALVAAATAGAFWGPFVVADRATLLVGDVHLQLSPGSALSAVGVRALTHGGALRVAQLGLGLLVAVVVARRGWTAAPLAAFALRLVIEPSTYPYYVVGIAAAAYLADLGQRRLPVLTIVAAVGWIVTESSPVATGAVLRLVEYGGLTATAVFLGMKEGRGQRRAQWLRPAAPHVAVAHLPAKIAD